MEVLGLLRSKQACLKMFLDATQAFALRAQEGDLAGLDVFERDRESALKALGLFDRRLSQSVSELPLAERSEGRLTEIRAALDAQSLLLEEIFRLDAQVMRSIEAEQLRLLREIAAAERSKDVMGRFKSGNPQKYDDTAPLAGLDRTV